MPLKETGEPIKDLGTWSAPAEDQEARKVIVHVSDEAVENFTWTTCFEVGSDMFDAGRFNDKKNPAVVRVTSQDVRDWLKSQD